MTSRPGDLLDADGRALPWPTATRSLRAIGIPGTVALLWEAHQQHGRHPWADLFDPAIALARDGFEPSPRLLRSVALAQRLGVAHSPAFQQLYLPGGRAIQAGARLRNPVLANSLEQLARHGGPSFYRGDLARQILRELDALRRDEPGFRGWSPVDLTTYKVIRREPLCSGWRGYRLCSMPAPSSGGLAIQQTLALWDALGGESSLQQPASWRRLAAAMAWADADRLYWVRDPLDGAPWIPALLTPQYIVSRAGGMALDHHRPPAPGLPRSTELSLREANPRARRRDHPDQHCGCRGQPGQLHRISGNRFRQPASGGRHGDEQPAHRLRLPAQHRRRSSGQPAPGRSPADVVHGAHHRVSRR